MKSITLAILLSIFITGYSYGQITTVDIAQSNNVYGFLVEHQSCLSADQNTGLITFTYRGKLGQSGCVSSGDIFVSQSRDTGSVWTSMKAYPNLTVNNRYPSGAIFNPSGNTNPDSAYAVFAGPAHDGVGWNKTFVGSMKMDSSNVNRQFLTITDAMLRNGMNATADGKVHIIGSSPSLSLYLDSIHLITGSFNSTNHNFEWTTSAFSANFISSTNGGDFAEVNSFNTAWSANGTIGYYWTVGRDISNDTRSYQPIVWKTINSGLSWSKMPVFDFSTLGTITCKLQSMNNVSPAQSRPQFSDKTEGVVDVNGNLHIIAEVQAAYSNHNDSLFYKYISATTSTISNPIFDVYTTSNGWAARHLGNTYNSELLSTQSTFGTSDPIGWDLRLQAGKTANGTKIFASWTDMDTLIYVTGNSRINLLPQIVVAAWDINTNRQIENVRINNSGSGYDLSQKSYFHYMSDLILSDNDEYTVPLSVLDIGNQPTDPVVIKYIKNVKFNNYNFVLDSFNSVYTLSVAFNAPTNLTTVPFTANFTNTSIGYNSFTWDFGDGDTSNQFSPSHTYLFNGTYNVTLYATDTITNISASLSHTVICSGGSGNPCNYTAELTQALTSTTICEGDSFRLSASAYNNINYSWVLNNVTIPNATDSIYYAKEQGVYWAVLSDSSCSKMTNNYFGLAIHSVSNLTINTVGSIIPCSNDSILLEASNGFSNYIWNNGKIGQTIYVNAPGAFIVSANDINSCISTSIETVIDVSMAETPEICVVSVDLITNNNIVKCEIGNSQNIDSFRVYKENLNSGIYNKIGNIAYPGTLEFMDMNSDVDAQQSSYKITTIDSCGGESPFSLKHKTIHLIVNEATNNNWSLSWNAYEGSNFTSYNIYRGTDSLNMTLLGTVSSNTLIYTDLTNPSEDLFYQIEVVLTNSCNGISRSNMFNTNQIGLGINPSEISDININISPNPNNGNFTIDITSNTNNIKTYHLEVYSTLGQLVYNKPLTFTSRLQKQMQLEYLSNGIYFIKLISDEGVLNARIIIE